jgi:hypothetical protein
MKEAVSKIECLGEAERAAVIVLGDELREHLALTETAFNLVGRAVGALPEVPVQDVSPSQNVATSLIIRLSNDMRSAALVAWRGYALQAATLVASMFEAAYSIAAIGTDDVRAGEWISHDNPKQSYGKLKDTIREGLENLKVPGVDTQAETEYKVYRQLCMAKHVNPLLQKHQGQQVDGNLIILMNGPDVSEAAVRVAWFALEHATGLACIALASFIPNHLPRDSKADFMRQVEAVGTERKRLEAAAKTRWGEIDPFAGHW